MNNGCSCARRTDEWHGWKCTITDGACMFYLPDAQACADIYDEGPLANNEQEVKSNE